MKILNLKYNKNLTLKPSIINNVKRVKKYFSPNNTEWNNSVYFYNKNKNKHLPVLDNVVLNIIKIYFNMYNIQAEKSVGLSKLTKRKRFLSLFRKVWVGKLNLKHFNDKVIINVFIYDKVNNLFLNKLRALMNNLILKKLNLKESYDFLKKNYNKLLTNTNINFPKSYGNELYNSTKIILDSKKIKLSKDTLWNEMNILYYKRFVELNTLKFKNNLIIVLQKFVSKVYNKKVTFNIVSLKNLYLNSDILTKMLVHQTKDRNNRIYRVIGNAVSVVQTPLLKKKFISKITKDKYYQKVLFKDNTKDLSKDNLNFIINDYYNSNLNTEYDVLNSLRNKSIMGIRLEAAGRLTKRFTAQRSVKRTNYVGTLKNADSSFRGVPAQMLRNSLENNMQFSKASSQNRIGSFGIRGWINSA